MKRGVIQGHGPVQLDERSVNTVLHYQEEKDSRTSVWQPKTKAKPYIVD